MCGCILGWRSVTYHNLVTVTLNLTSDLVSRNWCISPIFFEIGIPNLVCKCILGCLSVTNHFWVTVTLTSDLVFKNYCVQSISPILFDVGIPNLGWWFLLGWRSGAYNFESFWPWHWLLASFLGFSCYIIAISPQMCLVLDQFLWGHSSRVCDISCSVLSLFCGAFLRVLPTFAILSLCGCMCSAYLPCGCHGSVIPAFPGRTHLLCFCYKGDWIQSRGQWLAKKPD